MFFSLNGLVNIGEVTGLEINFYECENEVVAQDFQQYLLCMSIIFVSRGYFSYEEFNYLSLLICLKTNSVYLVF
eukprot:snap_masked-scaffold_129-processed-gene-0.7-mRNA-1 protein AED:1.00 eAED:1.00 QI:0/0/0/0/1/1/2/0/73